MVAAAHRLVHQAAITAVRQAVAMCRQAVTTVALPAATAALHRAVVRQAATTTHRVAAAYRQAAHQVADLQAARRAVEVAADGNKRTKRRTRILLFVFKMLSLQAEKQSLV